MTDYSETKRHLLACLRTELDLEYAFQVEFGQGSAVVQRIRVELSRTKKQFNKCNEYLKRQGKPAESMQQFKLHADVQSFRGDAPYDKVTLIRSQTADQRKTRAMKSLFKALTSTKESLA